VTTVLLDPELAQVVEHARQRAIESGEIGGSPGTGFTSHLLPEAQEILGNWLLDGGYAEAGAAVIVDHPDLATQ